MKFPRWTAAGLAAATLVAGCSSGAAAKRPVSRAQLQILSPTPDELITGPDVHLEFHLIGGTVVPAAQATGPLRGDQGHIHVSVDGQLVSMAYGLTQDLHGVRPGSHSLQAEFVAVDHRPFADRIVAAVLFTVKGT